MRRYSLVKIEDNGSGRTVGMYIDNETDALYFSHEGGEPLNVEYTDLKCSSLEEYARRVERRNEFLVRVVDNHKKALQEEHDRQYSYENIKRYLNEMPVKRIDPETVLLFEKIYSRYLRAGVYKVEDWEIPVNEHLRNENMRGVKGMLYYFEKWFEHNTEE